MRVELAIGVGALLVILSSIATRMSRRSGLPVPLRFLGIGMLVGLTVISLNPTPSRVLAGD